MSTETLTLEIDSDIAARLRAAGREPAEVAKAALEAAAGMTTGRDRGAQWRRENAAELQLIDSIASGSDRAEGMRSNSKETALAEWRATHRADLEAMDAELQQRDTFGGEKRAW